MQTYIDVLQNIFKDKTAVQLLLIAAIVCATSFALSWFFTSFLILIVFLAAFWLTCFLLDNVEAKEKVQSFLTSILAVNLNNANKPPDDESDKVEHELDSAIESFFKRIIKNFISNWYSVITQDEAFVWNIKAELATSLRRFAFRLKEIDYPVLLSNKLLPVAYSHVDILNRAIQDHHSSEDQVVQSFIENENHIHKATFSRNSEINYLRKLTKSLLPQLVTRNNYDCKILSNFLEEILTCSVLLPVMDLIADPAIINSLVILATNEKVQRTAIKSSCDPKVVLLENFIKQFEMSLSSGDENATQQIDGNFFKDQEKLYSFMQHLKCKSNKDIELLKFYLDVEHLNAELGNPSVITDPKKLSDLQQKSEKLLKFYQSALFQGEGETPDDLFKAHEHARKILEDEWKNDFYKSQEYFQLIYGDRENSNYYDGAKISMADAALSHQKFAAKLKNVMTIRTGTVEGVEATEIPIWDALDHPLGNTSYYNSVAVKLRKERGQDLDSFMQSFFHSIEQEADIGEDIASTQTRDEERSKKPKKPNHLGNVELYKNLFNLPDDSKISNLTSIPCVKTTVESVIYFLASILNVNDILLRLFNGFLRFFPSANSIIEELVRKFLHKIINQSILAKLISELEEKIFDTKPTNPPSHEELSKRRNLSAARLEVINKNLPKIHSYLQYPTLNKHLMYCLIDILIVELFPELNLADKD